MTLHTDILTWDGCKSLASRLAPGDAIEVSISGHPADYALAYGLMFGTSRAAFRGDTIVGAFGATREGAIWSLWAPLTRAESVQVLRAAPEWIGDLIKLSGLPRLHNYVHLKNRKAVEWIRATKCFAMDTCNPRVFSKADDAEQFYYFETSQEPRNV